MGECYEARIEKSGRARRIVNKDARGGSPDVDEVTIFVDHFGLFKGEYRSFNGSKVNRIWRLQRLDGGPWKIASLQHL